MTGCCCERSTTPTIMPTIRPAVTAAAAAAVTRDLAMG
eukprot:CAMPEP_0202835342 /NCGR_PEP_ID=MMETSP1389-20130828/36204_1 /ASSEMBLY_ACC=CAM_ASM_000865 /TAXON_ID=302021 /ORGANISM="Rhodomonas sp., Strain CCMP768" /LENGTH=37 /DNA_ID= /DNA_START= /DNA_END= /DNA_ORIENTATION=